MHLDSLRREFSLTQDHIFFNTPATGIIPQTVYKKRKQFLTHYVADPDTMMKNEDELINECKQKISEIYHADRDEIGLVPNYSIGMNFLLDAIPTDAHILILDADYPSVNLPVRARFENVFAISISADIEESIEKSIQEHQIDFVVCSLVQYMDGLKLDQQKLAAIKSRYPNLKFIIDATQYLGTEMFDFRKSPIDALGTSGYKWLNAGLGNGFFLIKKELVDQLETKSIGSNSQAYKPDGPFTPTGFLEPGHLDLIAFYTLKEALAFHYDDVGIKWIEKQNRELSKKMKIGLTDLGYLEDHVIQRKTHSTIFSLNADEGLFDHLQSKNIKCAMRGGKIRIGLNYFNTEQEIDDFLSIVEAF